ncbi:MAG: lysoplasmalogenase [Litorimonas sp.]
MKTLIKVAATAFLTLWAYVLGGPWLLVTALGFGAIGDGFMSGNPKKWLLPGLLAFFVGHLAYLALFMTTPHTPIDRVTLSIACGVFFFSGGFVLFLWKSLEEMRWPVVAYTTVIAFMGATAVLLDVGTSFVVIGAAMFILSDVLVAMETFKIEDDARIRLLTSPVLWALYFGGQALIAYGFLLSSQ